MKKAVFTGVLVATLSTAAQADIAGAKFGYNLWGTKNHGNAQTVYAQIEHPLPLIPNIGVRANRIDDNKLTLNTYDLFGYYEILDNSNLSLDLGFGVRRLDNGKLYNQSFSSTLPMLNADIELLPDSRFSFYGKVDAGKNGDTKFTDFNAGVRAKIIGGFYVDAGYRSYELNLDGTDHIHNDERIKGPQIGLHVDF